MGQAMTRRRLPRLTVGEIEALIHAASLANEEPATWEEYDVPPSWAAYCESGLDKLRAMLGDDT